MTKKIRLINPKYIIFGSILLILAGGLFLFYTPKITLAGEGGDQLYVDYKNGNDSGGCKDDGDPCKTITYALTKVSGADGDEINATSTDPDKTFIEQVSITSSHNGSEGKPTVIQNWDGKETPKIKSGSNSYGFDVNGASYITIKGFDLEEADVAAIRVRNSSDNIIIRDHTIDSDDAGILVDASSTMTIYGNTISKLSGIGISISNSSTDVTVKNNLISENLTGVLSGSSPSNKIFNNFIYNNTSLGVGVDNGSNTNLIINNTFYKNGTKGDIKIGGSGSDTEGTVLRNNAIYTSTYGINVTAIGTTNFDSDYNDIYPSGSGKAGKWSGTDTDALADWKTASSGDANSVSGDPGFASIESGKENLHISSSSPCYDTGTDTSAYGVTDDYDGDERAQGKSYDIGADETVPANRSLFMDSTNGTDSGTCQIDSSPCQSTSYVFEKVSSGNGDTIYATGSYGGNITIGTGLSGTASSLTTLTSWNNLDKSKADPVMDASGKIAGFIIEASYVTISGFEIKNATGYGISVTSDNVTLSNNTIHDNGEHGIRGNSISSNIYIGNTIYDNGHDGIGFMGASTDNIVSANAVYNNGHPGIGGDGLTSSSIFNNLVYSNGRSGISLVGGASENDVINNTLYQNNSDTGYADILVGDSKAGAASTTTLRNNIIYTNTYGIKVDSNSTANFGTSDYNDIYVSGSGKAGQWGGTDVTALADWQTASSGDANSISSDPVFTSTTSGSEDFHLLNSSPCIDAGTDVSGNGVTDDYDSDTRPYSTSATDIGADEVSFPGTPSSLASASITAASAALSWTAPYGTPTSYTISYGTDANATSLGTTTSTSVSKNLVGLTANTTYYYKVRATNATGNGVYSSAGSFTTLLSIPDNLASSDVADTSASLAWDAITGAANYTVSYGTDTNASNIGTATATINSHSLSGLSENTTYYFKVKANSTAGTNNSFYSSAANFTTLLTPPGVPGSLAAADITSSTAALTWTASANTVDTYTLQYATNANFSGATTVTGITTTSYSLSSLSAGTTYYCKVAGVNTDGTGDYTDSVSFTTLLAGPGLPGSGTSPASSSVSDQSYTISWDPVDGAASYQISFGTDTDASNLGTISVNSSSSSSSEVRTDSAPATTYTLADLDPSTKYYWKVAGVDENGVVGEYTVVSSFTTILASLGVTVTAHSDGGPIVRLYDADGQLVVSFFAYSETLRGEFKAMVADVDGNPYTKEIIVYPGSGFGPHLRVFNSDGEMLAQIMAYESTVRTGLNIVTGDLDNDGKQEIITVPGDEAGSHLHVYEYVSSTGSLVMTDSLFVYSSDLRMKINLATADLDGDLRDEIITVPADGYPAHLRVFQKPARNGSTESISYLAGTFVYADDFVKGANLATGDLDGDGMAEIAVAPAKEAAPNLRIYELDTTDNSLDLKVWTYAYSPNVRAGYDLALGDLDGDNDAELLIAPNTAGVGAQIRTYRWNASASSLHLTNSFFPYDENMQEGIGIVTTDIDNDGDHDLIVSPKASGPNTRIYENKSGVLTLKDWFWAFQETFTGGVNLGQ